MLILQWCSQSYWSLHFSLLNPSPLPDLPLLNKPSHSLTALTSPLAYNFSPISITIYPPLFSHWTAPSDLSTLSCDWLVSSALSVRLALLQNDLRPPAPPSHEPIQSFSHWPSSLSGWLHALLNPVTNPIYDLSTNNFTLPTPPITLSTSVLHRSTSFPLEALSSSSILNLTAHVYMWCPMWLTPVLIPVSSIALLILNKRGGVMTILFNR